jgi:hypothetical protein
VVQVKQGKLNFTTLADVPEGAAVLTGIFSIRDHPVRILFYSRATHSFISENLVSKLGLHSCHTKDSFVVATAGGRILSNTITKAVSLQLGSKTFLTNLIHLGLGGLDVILGMNWLTQHQVVLDIATRMIEMHSPTSGHTILYLPKVESTHPCSYAAVAIQLEDIPVVCKYPDVFPDDLPGMPPDRDVEFVIELQPGTAPISKRPYRMPPKELAELKVQLQELLDKGYIRPSSSPWGSAALFVKKKMVVCGCASTIVHSMRCQLRINIHFPVLTFSLINWLVPRSFPRLTFDLATIRSKFEQVTYQRQPFPPDMVSMNS